MNELNSKLSRLNTENIQLTDELTKLQAAVKDTGGNLRAVEQARNLADLSGQYCLKKSVIKVAL